MQSAHHGTESLPATLAQVYHHAFHMLSELVAMVTPPGYFKSQSGEHFETSVLCDHACVSQDCNLRRASKMVCKMDGSDLLP